MPEVTECTSARAQLRLARSGCSAASGASESIWTHLRAVQQSVSPGGPLGGPWRGRFGRRTVIGWGSKTEKRPGYGNNGNNLFCKSIFSRSKSEKAHDMQCAEPKSYRLDDLIINDHRVDSNCSSSNFFFHCSTL